MKEQIITNIAVAMRLKNYTVSSLSEKTGIARQTIKKIITTGEGRLSHIEKLYEELQLKF